MQSNATIFPIIHPKRVRRETRSWKHKGKRPHQSRVVTK